LEFFDDLELSFAVDIEGSGKKMKSPGIGEQCGSHTECDAVRQGIKFFAECGGGIGGACDPAIQSIKNTAKPMAMAA